MRKKILGLGLTVFMVLGVSILGNADTIDSNSPQPARYQVGWQFSKTGNGFSIKIPFQEYYYIQPVFAFKMSDQPGTGTAQGHFVVGLRGILQLPARDDFQPYAGISWGHSEDFAGTNVSQAVITKGNTGYEAFLGVEYQKYIIRPTLEIGLGSYNRADGSYYAGTTFNFGLMYSF
jgi:hypothetical protein